MEANYKYNYNRIQKIEDSLNKFNSKSTYLKIPKRATQPASH